MTTRNPAQADTLSPCPFCGGAAVTIDDRLSRSGKWLGYETIARCNFCLSKGPFQWFNRSRYTKEERRRAAIQMWNERKCLTSARDTEE